MKPVVESTFVRTLPSVAPLLALAVSAWWLLGIVDSALPQLQMALFGGMVPIRGVLLDILFLGLLGLLALLRGSLPPAPMGLGTATAAFGAYLFVELLFLYARRDTSILGLVTDYYRYYFFLLVLPFAYYAQSSLDARRLLRILLLAFVPLAWLGLQQHFGGDPLLPTASADGRFQVFAWAWQGEVRAFSLFNSGWSFGHYAVLAAALAWFLAGEPQTGPATRRLCLLLIPVALVCVYASQTRTVFLVAAAAVVASLVLARTRRRGVLDPAAVLMPLAFAGVGYLVAHGAQTIVEVLDLRGESLFATGSIEARWDAWAEYGSRWLQGSWAEMWFGLGIGQHDSGMLYSESTVLIDNMLIAVGAQLGLIGVILWLVMMWKIWRMVLARALDQDTALHWGIAAMWAAWPLSLTFSASSLYYGLLAIGAVLAARPSLRESAVDGDTELAQRAYHGVGDQPVTGHAWMGVVRQK